MQTREYLRFLNDEAELGGLAATTLAEAGIADREGLLEQHPEWLRYGTLTALLNIAHEALDRDVLVTLDLVRFVLAHVDDVPLPPSPAFLRDQLRGLAWKERGNALYLQGRDYQEAAGAALRAAEIFATKQVLDLERASALVLLAMALHKLQKEADADEVLLEAIRIFADHGEARRYVDAIQTQGLFAVDRNDLPLAREHFLRAYEEADHLDDRAERTRIINNLGFVALRMHEAEDAREYFSRALAEMTALRWTSEIQRVLWNIASVEREQGNLPAALSALCGVYPKLLERGLVADAMAVLVDIHDVIVEATGDVAYAQSLCAKLVATTGQYEVPANVLEAIDYFRTTMEGQPPLAVAQRALGHVRTYLHEVLTSVTPVRFVAPE